MYPQLRKHSDDLQRTEGVSVKPALSIGAIHPSIGRHRYRLMLDRGHAAAIMLTDTAANTMPMTCQRVTRSRNTMIARITVVAGYSEIKMLASDSIHFWIASSMVMLAQVSSSAAATASRSGVLGGS